MDKAVLIFLLNTIIVGFSSIVVNAGGDDGENRDFANYKHFRRFNDESDTSPRCTSCGTVDDGFSNNPPSGCDQELYCTSKSQTNFQRRNVEELLDGDFDDFVRLYNDVVLYKNPPIGTYPLEIKDKEACDSSVDFQLVTHAQTFPHGWAPLVQERNYFQYFRIERCTKSDCNALCSAGSCSSQSTICRTIMNRQRVLVWKGNKVVSALAILPESCKCVKRIGITPAAETTTAPLRFDQQTTQKRRRLDQKTTSKRTNYGQTTQQPRMHLTKTFPTSSRFATSTSTKFALADFNKPKKMSKHPFVDSYKQFDPKTTPKRSSYGRTTEQPLLHLTKTVPTPKLILADFNGMKYPSLDTYGNLRRKTTPKRTNYGSTAQQPRIPSTKNFPASSRYAASSNTKSTLADFTKPRKMSTESPTTDGYGQFDRKTTTKRSAYVRTTLKPWTRLTKSSPTPPRFSPISNEKSTVADIVESKTYLSTKLPSMDSYPSFRRSKPTIGPITSLLTTINRMKFDAQTTPKLTKYDGTTQKPWLPLTKFISTSPIFPTVSNVKSTIADLNEWLSTENPLLVRYESFRRSTPTIKPVTSTRRRQFDLQTIPQLTKYGRTTEKPWMRLTTSSRTLPRFPTISNDKSVADFIEPKTYLSTEKPLMDSYQSFRRSTPTVKLTTTSNRRKFDAQTTPKLTKYGRTTQKPWTRLTKSSRTPPQLSTMSNEKSTVADIIESKTYLSTKAPLMDIYQSFRRSKSTIKSIMSVERTTSSRMKFDQQATPKLSKYGRTTEKPWITKHRSSSPRFLTTPNARSTVADVSEVLSTENPLLDSYRSFKRSKPTIEPITSHTRTTSNHVKFDPQTTPELTKYGRTTQKPFTKYVSTSPSLPTRSNIRSTFADTNERLSTETLLLETYQSLRRSKPTIKPLQFDQQTTSKLTKYGRTTQKPWLRTTKISQTPQRFSTKWNEKSTAADIVESKTYLSTKNPSMDRYQHSIGSKPTVKPTTSSLCCDKRTTSKQRKFDAQTTAKLTKYDRTTQKPWMPLTKFATTSPRFPYGSNAKSTAVDRNNERLAMENPLLDTYQSFKRDKQTARTTSVTLSPTTEPPFDDDTMEEECPCKS